ncbi:MAG: tRNA (guanosine(37)-N1)-methyltransferase TrmD [Coriobacteriia bacterium]|nr:tRNA (guanosine(37)-N1)-methyltransferase TrmD [Coriobacteriia bacterium]
MKIQTLSVFPQVFEGANSPLGVSIIGRARSRGILELVNHDLRDWTHDRHRTTDDQPFGGGQGLLMKVEPVFEALDELTLSSGPSEPDDPTNSSGLAKPPKPPKPEIIFFAPFGDRFDQKAAQSLAASKHLIMVCGRYEGFDERVYHRADRIISLGDFILTGAELAAMCVIDAVCRLLPGALRDERSSVDESFTDGLLEYPQYTRPADFQGWKVPDVLLSGNHALIDKWRREQSIIRTAQLRPDLLESAKISEAERVWVDEYLKRGL